MIRLAHWRILVVCIVSVLFSERNAVAQGAFYQATEQETAGPAGTLIRQEPMPFLGGKAFRILYRSTGMHDEPIAVSGVVVVPPGPPPPGGRPIVAWAHPTTGIAPRCAPSLARFVLQQMQGLRDMVDRGYIVAATDYPGLGTPGPHPYLVGASEARAVLDSVRAARTIPDAGASGQLAVWGHSQGGQAALFTGAIAKSYAPELKLMGVAAAAPASELITLIDEDLGSIGGKNIAAMTLWSWARVYGAPIQDVVVPAAMPTIDLLASSRFSILSNAASPDAHWSKISCRSAVRPRSSPGARCWLAIPREHCRPRFPFFSLRGTADAIIRSQVTNDYMKRLCSAGSKVQLLELPGVGHGFAAHDSASAAVDWIGGRFNADPSPNDCGRS
jgi:pimeloyl-ACP methyl ester carboxylesterase